MRPIITFFPDLVQEHGVSTSVDSLGSERPLSSWRKAVWWGCVAALMAGAEVRADQGSPETAAPEALGVIVKLKDGRLTTADGRGMARPSSFAPEVAQRRRMLMAQVAQRQRVSYLVQKDTVFGAQVLHRGEAVALKDAEAEAARLRQDPEVEWAVPNEIMKAASVTTGQSVPSVNYSGRFWLRSRAAEGNGVADFPAAWAFLQGRTLNPVVTAVLDSGVTEHTTHPDFVGRLHTGHDFITDAAVASDGNGRDADVSDLGDWTAGCTATPSKPQECSSWHGTSITSMLASPLSSTTSGAVGTDQQMGPGILAPIDGQAVVLPIRVGGKGGASSNDIIEAMYWAAGLSVAGVPANANPARVISLSYGAPGNCQGGASTVDALYRNAIATLRSLGVVIVASAGNGDGQGVAGYATPSKPASCQGVIASTGLQKDASKAAYANLVNGTRASQCYFGVAVASGASGQPLSMLGNTGTTTPGTTNLQGGIAGTSFAAPQVAGVAALMLAVNPALSSVDVAYRIMQSATTFPVSGPAVCSDSNLGNCRCTSETCGSGVLNAAAALAAAQSPRLFAEGMCPPPDVEAAATRGGGGGGGASDVGLLTLLAALVSWMLGGAAWRHVKSRQAVRVIKNDKR